MAQGNKSSKSNQVYKNDDREAYIDGNTVRWQQAAPAKEIPERRPQRELPERTHEEIIRDRQRRLAAKRNRKRAQVMNRGYVFFLTAATVVCCGICAIFIHMQSNITTHMSEIAALETQLSDLKADNDATESRMQSTMTLDEVKEKAGELGLVYPSSEQIQHYTVDSSDYMNQY